MNGPATEQVITTDAAFFAALLDQDLDALDVLLADDFLIIEVGTGSVHPRAEFLGAIENGLVVFQAIEVDPSETVVRQYGAVAVVVGRTRMTIVGPDASTVEVASRYSHVFVADGGGWRLASAQGTAIGS